MNIMPINHAFHLNFEVQFKTCIYICIYYFRIIVVENPFLKFVDYYQHYFVHTPRQTEGYTEEVVTHWLLHRSDKLAKDMGKGEGEKYFETSDLKKGILTFKQFVTFITTAPSETMMGKVRSPYI